MFDTISSNINKVLSINPFANMFVFRDFNVLHKECPIYSGGADRAGKLCSNYMQYVCEGLSSFNPKGFCYSYAWSCGLCEGRLSFAW